MLPRQLTNPLAVCPKIPDHDLYRYGAGVLIPGFVQPVTARTAAAVYGEKIARMRTVYADPHPAWVEGSGVCLQVHSYEPCDYRIVSVAPWQEHHVEVQLEWIEPAARGERG